MSYEFPLKLSVDMDKFVFGYAGPLGNPQVDFMIDYTGKEKNIRIWELRDQGDFNRMMEDFKNTKDPGKLFREAQRIFWPRWIEFLRTQPIWNVEEGVWEDYDEGLEKLKKKTSRRWQDSNLRG